MSTQNTTAPVADPDADLLGGSVSTAPPTTVGRYAIASTAVECGYGERVGIGRLIGKDESPVYLVHTHGKMVQAIPAHAVGAALAGGALPAAAVAGAFARAGNLAALAAAVKAAGG